MDGHKIMIDLGEISVNLIVSLHAQLPLEGHPAAQAEEKEKAFVLFRYLLPAWLEDQNQEIRSSVFTLQQREKL